VTLELSLALTPGLAFALAFGLPLTLTPELPLALAPGLPLGPQPYNPFVFGPGPKARVATFFLCKVLPWFISSFFQSHSIKSFNKII